MHPKVTGKVIVDVIKEVADASMGVITYGTNDDGTIKERHITKVIETANEVAEASAGVNACGTNVDNKMGKHLEWK